MKLLVIGGTRFVGQHMVAEALARGHEVTIFHRGQTGTAPAGVEEVLGDRLQDLGPLANRRWDAVLDMCGYTPEAVEASARFLQDAVGLYAFVSTIAVYRQPLAPHADEQAPLADPSGPDGQTYGPLKVACERALDRLLPGRVLHIRPGIVAGPLDHTDRFSYWARRLSQAGPVLVPGPPERPVQFIDGRDLAAWSIRAIEAGLTGPYNVVGPREPLTMGGWVEATGAEAVWVPPAALVGVELEATFPFFVFAEDWGFFQADVGKAIATGLAFRPLAETTRDTLAWLAQARPGAELKAGPTPAQEQAWLQAHG